MGSISIWHWLIVGLIVALVFGTKKLRTVGGDLGTAIRGFKEAVNTETPEGLQATTNPAAENPHVSAAGLATAASLHPQDGR